MKELSGIFQLTDFKSDLEKITKFQMIELVN